MSCEYIARLRFFSVVGCIIAGIWALLFMSGTMADSRRGYWPAPTQSFIHRDVEGLPADQSASSSTADAVEISSTQLPRDTAE